MRGRLTTNRLVLALRPWPGAKSLLEALFDEWVEDEAAIELGVVVTHGEGRKPLMQDWR